MLLIYLYMTFLKFIIGHKVTTKTNCKFLPWQTWDLLRLMVHGFKEFTADFLLDHLGYAIYPVRINGSAVETLFSQFKHATSSQLSGVNYSSAKASILTRGSIQGKKTNHGYRSAPLFLRQQTQKKAYCQIK